GQQAALMVMPDGADGDPHVVRELADGEHHGLPCGGVTGRRPARVQRSHRLRAVVAARLNSARAPRYPARASPAHHTHAISGLLPAGTPSSRLRMVSMMGVNGWYSENQRSPGAIAAAGTNALPRNGRSASGRG